MRHLLMAGVMLLALARTVSSENSAPVWNQPQCDAEVAMMIGTEGFNAALGSRSRRAMTDFIEAHRSPKCRVAVDEHVAAWEKWYLNATPEQRETLTGLDPFVPPDWSGYSETIRRNLQNN